MLEKFIKHIREKELGTKEDKILLAVSGGMDSSTMAHLYRESGFSCTIAHCNFQLRGEESDRDEAFVRELAGNLAMPFLSKRFSLNSVKRGREGSIQTEARELRYAWFGKLLKEEGLDLVATAHNLDDSVETFFMNLTRGTGIRGLTGIPVRSGSVIRPLLFATRDEIQQYVSGNRIQFREDSSNLERKYRRNAIRHDVVPILKGMNPNFTETMSQNMDRLDEVREIFSQHLDRIREELFVGAPGRWSVEIRKLCDLEPRNTWIFELFTPYGFTRSQCKGIAKMMDAKPGRQAISETHRVFKDRDHLLLVASEKHEFHRFYLDRPRESTHLPFPMDVELLDRSQLRSIPEDPLVACLDLDRIQFPLTIRHWMHGDYFYPLGMDQMKKLSDFFVDNKVAVPDKERMWIMASGDEIVWIVGQRIDNRFRITKDTKTILLLRCQAEVLP